MPASQTRAADAVENALRQVFRWGNLPRFKERLAARAGMDFDRASYALIAPLTHGPLRVSQLAEHAGIDVSTASRQLVQLERDGVLRRRADARDGRASLVELTARGRRNLERIAAARSAIVAELLEDFSVDDIERFATLLERFAANLKSFVEERG